jgi:hypothetical protein
LISLCPGHPPPNQQHLFERALREAFLSALSYRKTCLADILLVSKQNYEEAVPFLYRSCTFLFEDFELSTKFLSAVSPGNLKHITKVMVYYPEGTMKAIQAIRDCPDLGEFYPQSSIFAPDAESRLGRARLEDMDFILANHTSHKFRRRGNQPIVTELNKNADAFGMTTRFRAALGVPTVDLNTSTRPRLPAYPPTDWRCITYQSDLIQAMEEVSLAYNIATQSSLFYPSAADPTIPVAPIASSPSTLGCSA